MRMPAPTPGSITRATPSRPCCIAPSARILRPGLSWPVPASLTVKVITTHPAPTSARRFANTSNAVSSPTALPAPAVMTVGMTTLWRSRAKAGVFAPRAIPGAWPRLRHTWLTTSCRTCRCASGCCQYPSGCATSCSAMGRYSTWCCGSSCGSLSKACSNTAPVPHKWTRQPCASVPWLSFTGLAPA